jgi:uncharacterized protein
MDKSRLEIKPGIWLDHRRAAYLEADRILCVSDLHLGYAWAHRFSGQLMPLKSDEDLLTRLSDLCSFYKPAHLAILGDIVHHSLPVAEIRSELQKLFHGLQQICGLKLILGNHDANLRKLAKQIDDLEFLERFETDTAILLHGHENKLPPATKKLLVMGHEHPSVSLGDGIRSAKFPCFLTSPSVIVLPAFSLWAAGTDIRGGTFLSIFAQNAQFKKAIAICGNKLLPVNLG